MINIELGRKSKTSGGRFMNLLKEFMNRPSASLLPFAPWLSKKIKINQIDDNFSKTPSY